MSTRYNLISGQNLSRLAALSDGIFAVAMTLLVLDLRVPLSSAIQSEQALWDTLVQLAPRFLTYLMSFLTLGIFWVGQQTQLNHFARSNRNLAWIHLTFLLGVTLLPFSTALLADFITFRLALIIYWLNLLLLGIMLYWSRSYAQRAELFSEDTTPEILAVTKRRIVLYQVLYALGALLCLINNYVSIVFIVLLQLNSAIAPRIWLLDKF